jgi:hypothetical protein
LKQPPCGKRKNKSKNNKQDNTNNNNTELLPFYQQDLVLKSQRVITSHTGIMRYSQKIVIDKIITSNENDSKNAKYCVSIQMMDPRETSSSSSTDTAATTVKKPFEALYVHVNLEPSTSSSSREHHPAAPNSDVYVYAAGLLKVNRKVVPNLVVFDASGIAGSMAGKGTLWLTAYFKQRQLERRQRQKEQQHKQEQQEQHTLQQLSRRRPANNNVVWACRRAQQASSSSSTIINHHHEKRHHVKTSWQQHLLLPPWWPVYERSASTGRHQHL